MCFVVARGHEFHDERVAVDYHDGGTPSDSPRKVCRLCGFVPTRSGLARIICHPRAHRRAQPRSHALGLDQNRRPNLCQHRWLRAAHNRSMHWGRCSACSAPFAASRSSCWCNSTTPSPRGWAELRVLRELPNPPWRPALRPAFQKVSDRP